MVDPRIAQVRALVADGTSVQEAAAAVGVDPIILRLWLALPADWGQRPGDRGDGASDQVQPEEPAPVPPSPTRGPSVTWPGAMRPLLILVPAGIARDSGDVARALSAELTPAAIANAVRLAKRGWYAGRPWYYTLPTATVASIVAAAEAAEVPALLVAGNLLASRLERPISRVGSAPSAPATAPKPRSAASLFTPGLRQEIARRTKKGPGLPKVAEAGAEQSAPTGAELAARRHEAGLSQRDLARLGGFSRGLIAEIERGRRKHVGTRLRLEAVLRRLALGHPRTPATPVQPWTPPRSLTDEETLAIRAARAIGATVKALATEYGVSSSAIYRCVRGSR